VFPTYHLVSKDDVLDARLDPATKAVIHSVPHGVTADTVEGDDRDPRVLAEHALIAAVNDHQRLVLLDPERGMATGLTLASLASGAVPHKLSDGVLAADYAPDGTIAVARRRSDGGCLVEEPPGTQLWSDPGHCVRLRASRMGTLGWSVIRNGQTEIWVAGPGEQPRRLATFGQITGLAWDDQTIVVSDTPADRVEWAVESIALDGTIRRLETYPGPVQVFDVADGRVLLGPESDRTEVRVRKTDGSYRVLSFKGDGVFGEIARGSTLLYLRDDGKTGVQAFLGNIDDRLPISLGEGFPEDISADGKRVLLRTLSQLSVVTVGVAQRKVLAVGPITNYRSAVWLDDGRVALLGSTNGGPRRWFVQDPATDAPPTPIGPSAPSIEFDSVITPDGSGIVSSDGTNAFFDPVVTGPRRQLGQGVLFQVTGDSKYVLLGVDRADGLEVSRVRIADGHVDQLASLPDKANVYQNVSTGDDGATLIVDINSFVVGPLYVVDNLIPPPASPSGGR
jgi:hypothetical protein